jgi:DNA polymerase II small subunit
MNYNVTLALNYALTKGFQIHPDALKILQDVDTKQLQRIIKDLVKEKAHQKNYLINQDDLETFLGIKEEADLKVDYKILSDPSLKITSAEGINGYNSLFSSRFAKLKKIISSRPESKMVKSSALIIGSKTNEDVYVCGLVSERISERNITKLVLDDPTGSIEIIVFDNELQKTADSLLNDQFVMARIATGKNGGFITKDLIVPDIPDHQANRSESETYVVFLSDLHIGSKFFMEDEFKEFVSWLSSPDPIARKIHFIVIGGDLVDGVGIYPNQDKELLQQTIEEQLEKTNELLSQIPKHIKVFIIPGNHDPGRRALPQPAIPEKYHPPLWDHENFVMLGNPSTVSLNGVKVMIFHGQSIDDIVKTTPGLSYDKPADVMRHLLMARHVSPIFGSQTPIAPELEDMMVVDEIPDILHVGHVHVVDLDMYRGVLLVNSGAWQSQTLFQASVGITPTPGLAVIVNLKNFKVFYKDFKSEV